MRLNPLAVWTHSIYPSQPTHVHWTMNKGNTTSYHKKLTGDLHTLPNSSALSMQVMWALKQK